jgi:hypothetical protein
MRAEDAAKGLECRRQLLQIDPRNLKGTVTLAGK